MASREDDCRTRAKNAAEVMNILRKTSFADAEDLQHIQVRDEEQSRALRTRHSYCAAGLGAGTCRRTYFVSNRPGLFLPALVYFPAP